MAEKFTKGVDQEIFCGRSVPHRIANGCTWLALIVAGVALAGSIWLSVGLGLKACPLCFYQRTFVMSAFAVLALGLLTSRRQPILVSLLAFPLAAAGLGVALFHLYLEATGKLECPAGVFALGTAPQQSAAVLALLTGLLAIALADGAATRTIGIASCFAGLVLSGLLAYLAIASAPPMPSPPPQPYAQPLNEDMCRPPYAAQR